MEGRSRIEIFQKLVRFEMAGKRTNVEQMTGPATNGFTKAYGTAHDSEDDVSNYGDHDHDHEDDQ